MDILVSHHESEVLTILEKKNIHNKYLGILNSEYKAVTKQNIQNLEFGTIYGNKQLVKSRLYKLNSGVEFGLRVAVFLAIFSLIF
jgi:hypothetical protein